MFVYSSSLAAWAVSLTLPALVAAGESHECPACRESIVNQAAFAGVLEIPANVRPHEGAQPTIVAIIEPSMDHSLPLISGHLWRNKGEGNAADGVDNDGNEYYDDINGWDFSRRRAVPFEPGLGHGTAVAGVIAGAAERSGLDLRLMLLGARDESSTAEAIAYAVRNGARIISTTLWLTCSSTGCPLLHKAAEEAGRKNVLMVFAAGNSGRELTARPEDSYPALLGLNMSHVLTVQAARYCGSNWATGVRLLSGPIGASFPCTEGSPFPFGKTSAATAFSAAAAGIVMQCQPDVAATPASLIRWLHDHAVHEPLSCPSPSRIAGFYLISLKELGCRSR